MLQLLVDADIVAPGDFAALRNVIWWDSILPDHSLRYWMTRLGHVRFTSLYGSSETTVVSAYYTVPRAGRTTPASLPIGTACPGHEVLLLGANLQPVGPDEIGEICIGGLGLSPGYWQDTQATMAAFRTIRSGAETTQRLYRTGDLGRRGRDGQIYVVGRRDAMSTAPAAPASTSS
jgi:non-ribosomal peptide synthetase component F